MTFKDVRILIKPAAGPEGHFIKLSSVHYTDTLTEVNAKINTKIYTVTAKKSCERAEIRWHIRMRLVKILLCAATLQRLS